MDQPSGVKASLTACIAAALLAAACYLNTLGNQFVFDDLDIVARNPLVTGTGGGLRGIFTSHYWSHLTPTGDLYRPFTIASYALNHWTGRLDPTGYHLVNITLHALCSGLVVALAARFGMPAPGALAAGALFAAHPIHTEAVAAIVGRAELMAAAAVIGSWVVHLSARRANPGRAAAVAALLAAGLLSKENAVVLPGLMAAGDLWRTRRGETTWREAAPSYAACAAVLAGWLALRAALLSPVPAGSVFAGPFDDVPAIFRIYTAVAIVGRYIWLLIFPISLSADYSYAQIAILTSPADPLMLLSALLLTAMALFGLWSLASRSPARIEIRQMGLCAILFLVSVAPVSNIFVPIGAIMGERLLYLPSVGFCLALPALWGLLESAVPRVFRRGAGAGLAGLLVLLYAARTIPRNADWKDQLTLFSATSITSPRSAKAHYNLGVALEDELREAEALQQYLIAISIKPHDAKSHHNAGLLLARLDRPAEAATHLEQAAKLDPELPALYSSLGVTYNRLGRDRDAESAFRLALARDPKDHSALYNLGTMLLVTGRLQDAILALEAARGVDPSDPDGRYHLGLTYLAADQPRQALVELEAALRLSPSLHEAHLQMALAYLRLGMATQAAAAAARARASGLPLPPELQSLTRGETAR